MKKLDWEGVISLEFDRESHLENNLVENTTTSTAATPPGSTAMSTSEVWSTTSTEINNGTTTVPYNLNSEVPFMSGEDAAIFESSFLRYLHQALKEKMEITSVTVEGQEYDRPCVSAVVHRTLQNSFLEDTDDKSGVFEIDFSPENTQQSSKNQRTLPRDDPAITALDITTRISAQYVHVENNVITDSDFQDDLLETINLNQQLIADAIRSNSSSFFAALSRITAISTEILPERPSLSPSSPPSRSRNQILETSIDSAPTGSYGIIFSVRTLPNVATVLVTGMSFITLHTGTLEYEVYTKLGSYDGYHGKKQYFDLIASGETIGMGSNDFTHVLDDDKVIMDGNVAKNYIGFQPVHIPGDGGLRSFYITITKKFDANGQPIPILFSYPKRYENEGKNIYDVVARNEELEILEGDGVLGMIYVIYEAFFLSKLLSCRNFIFTNFLLC